MGSHMAMLAAVKAPKTAPCPSVENEGWRRRLLDELSRTPVVSNLKAAVEKLHNPADPAGSVLSATEYQELLAEVVENKAIHDHLATVIAEHADLADTYDFQQALAIYSYTWESDSDDWGGVYSKISRVMNDNATRLTRDKQMAGKVKLCQCYV